MIKYFVFAQQWIWDIPATVFFKNMLLKPYHQYSLHRSIPKLLCIKKKKKKKPPKCFLILNVKNKRKNRKYTYSKKEIKTYFIFIIFSTDQQTPHYTCSPQTNKHHTTHVHHRPTNTTLHIYQQHNTEPH
jgi:hypothetical protein